MSLLKKYVKVDPNKVMKIGKRYDLGFNIMNPYGISTNLLEYLYNKVIKDIPEDYYITAETHIIFESIGGKSGTASLVVRPKEEITPYSLASKIIDFAKNDAKLILEFDNVKTFVFRWELLIIGGILTVGAIGLSRKKEK